MPEVEHKLTSMGLELPTEPEPLAQYVPAKRVGDMVYVSGQVPVRNGEFVHVGAVGDELTVEQGRECARVCVLNALAAVKSVIGDLDGVAEIVQVRGFVNSAPGFGEQPEVLNAASELLVELFGENGRHARAAVGTSALPRNLPVELEMVVRVAD
ncbi:MAG: RidA family protein [Candidatus Brocadiia bacterium]